MAPAGSSKRVNAVDRSTAGRRGLGGVISRVRMAAVGKSGAARPIATRHTRALLPGLHRHTQGKAFRAQALRSFLRKRLAGKSFQVPGLQESERLLRSLCKAPGHSGDGSSPLGAWQSSGARYIDPEGEASVSNLQGFVQGPRREGGSWVAWNEYGALYRLRRVDGASGRSAQGGRYQVVCSRAFKRLSFAVTRKTLAVTTEARGQAEFKSSIVLEPRRVGVGKVAPAWSLIYLHSFSNKATDYAKYPHYFGVSGAALRVVLPSAPQQEQTCFKDWHVWRGEKLQWRRIKFTSWFDYLTDRAGKAENDIDLQSLLDMRARIHHLIRQEVQRVGDPRRVIIGGASQGCCVALDAALTYPEELGGVIGIVGHVLGSTPLDPTKRGMPLHLFHETSDKEMRWSWVKGTVQRLVDAGFNVTSKREADPAGCGHWVQEIEGQWIRSALRRIIHTSAMP
mmetsp:Transcript_124277/g.359397  ORF Transcript_124277/g.359397 Transcript_124277/m.359397 type:complete len:453 (-) Transcript_124277:177-1535(-)